MNGTIVISRHGTPAACADSHAQMQYAASATTQQGREPHDDNEPARDRNLCGHDARHCSQQKTLGDRGEVSDRDAPQPACRPIQQHVPAGDREHRPADEERHAQPRQQQTSTDNRRRPLPDRPSRDRTVLLDRMAPILGGIVGAVE